MKSLSLVRSLRFYARFQRARFPALIPLTLLALSLPAAAHAQPPAKSHLRQLTDAQIRAARAGKRLRPSPDFAPILPFDHSIWFQPDGSYTEATDWGRVQGSYTVQNGLLCALHSKGEPLCRTLYRDRRGRMFQRFEGSSQYEEIVLVDK